MNERIKELMGKTLDDKFSHTWDTMTHEGLLMFSEKFAELIVRECLDQLHVSDWDEDYDKGIYWSREQIKNHFGVEE